MSHRPTTLKTFGPGRISNSKSGRGRIWKIISGATLLTKRHNECSITNLIIQLNKAVIYATHTNTTSK